MPQQELNLLDIPTVLPAELRASTPEVVRPEALDTDVLRGLFNYGPDCQIAQRLPKLSTLGNRPQQRPVFDSGRGLPRVDAVLDPDRDGNGPDAPSLPFQVGKDPAALSQLDGFDVERGEFLRTQAQPISNARMT